MQTKAKAGAGAGIGTVLLVAVILILRLSGGSSTGTGTSPVALPTGPNDASVDPPGESTGTLAPADSGSSAIERLFETETSDEMVTFTGRVDRVLRDDNEGSRHQKFIVELSSGRTVLIAHNIDLAERVPLERGHRVTVRGEYEWTQQGGTVHWTHHDPKGWREGGWIEHDGVRYE